MIFLLLCYLAGAVTVLILEAALLVYALNRLSRRQKPETLVQEETDSVPELAPDHTIVSLLNKKGVIWILEPDNVPKIQLSESNQQKSKREVVEVAPVRRFARIEGQALILNDAEGGQSSVQLRGCTVAAVSASNLPTRKWAKRYPIRLENKNSVVYNGSNICYIYVETSWEKEAWCRALCLASRMDKRKLRWYMQISKEFLQYVTTLNTQYPFFAKPSAAVFIEPADRSQRLDGSSKVRLFLKKIAKKASRVGSEGRMGIGPFLASEEKRSSNKLGATDVAPYGVSGRSFSAEKHNANSSQKDLTFPMGVENGANDQVSVSSDMEQDCGPSSNVEGCQEKPSIDEGTLCWNLLFSRLFFDAKKSQEIVNFMQARIQKSLSNIRTPSYVGGVTCTKLDLGNFPPYVHHMRVLPMDMNDVWAIEVDIEYSGGAVLYIETRLEVGAPDFQKGIIGASLESSSEREANTDFLEGLEQLRDQLGLSQDASDDLKKGTEDDSKGEDDSKDGKSFKSTNWRTSYVSRLKSKLSSFADQVSQMPLSLAVKVTLLRGTVRIHIKPPPSDQVWIAFTTMPQIEWDLDSHVGDHKFTNAQIALFFGKRIKAALKNSMVLPNCECIRMPWMVAEKDDWVPRDVAPFIWLHQEASESEKNDASDTQPNRTQSRAEPKKGSKQGSGRHPKDGADISDVDSLNYQLGKSKNRQEPGKGSTESFFGYPPTDDAENLESLVSSQTSEGDTSTVVFPSSPTTVTSSSPEQSMRSDITNDLKVPLLNRDDGHDSYAAGSSRQLVSDRPGTVAIPARQYSSNDMADSDKSKKFGRRARMMDIGKKMGEKLEEKRRHFEEKGRLMVEKMRGNENMN